MEKILSYFPELSSLQQERLASLMDLYQHWNARINVISRKDIDQLYLRHVLHSMAIARVVRFADGTQVLDAGTGGGFPGIPLAILFPGTQFRLVDSIGKKIKVVQAIAGSLGLENVRAEQKRMEELHESYDFIVSRAVTTLGDFYSWMHDKIRPKGSNSIPNGMLYLKGGDLSAELKTLKCKNHIYKLSDFFKEDFFSTKHLVHLYP